MLRKRAAYFWLTGASRTECERSRGVIRLGWVDIEPSFHLCGPFGCSSPHGTGDVSQFDSFPPPCPTTSRPRDIPAGNIRQHQIDSSHQLSLSKSLRGCGAAVSEALLSRQRQPHLLHRQALGRRLGKTWCASASTTASQGRLNKTPS